MFGESVVVRLRGSFDDSATLPEIALL